MTLAISAPVIRIFEAGGLSFPRTVAMPPGETSPCRHVSSVDTIPISRRRN
jgi:hypothetical protein